MILKTTWLELYSLRYNIVCPLADQYDVFVDWKFFSMSTDLIRCAGRGHLTVDVLWKNFEIWMGQLKVKVKHAPSLTKCWARWARSCVDLVWIVLSCQATQAERPDSLTQSKPNLCMVLLHSAQHFWVTEAWITLTFNCPIQISNFFHKTSTVRCPLPAHLIKSVDIEKKFSVDKNVIWAFEGTDYIDLTSICVYLTKQL